MKRRHRWIERLVLLAIVLASVGLLTDLFLRAWNDESFADELPVGVDDVWNFFREYFPPHQASLSGQMEVAGSLPMDIDEYSVSYFMLGRFESRRTPSAFIAACDGDLIVANPLGDSPRVLATTDEHLPGGILSYSSQLASHGFCRRLLTQDRDLILLLHSRRGILEAWDATREFPRWSAAVPGLAQDARGIIVPIVRRGVGEAIVVHIPIRRQLFFFDANGALVGEAEASRGAKLVAGDLHTRLGAALLVLEPWGDYRLHDRHGNVVRRGTFALPPDRSPVMLMPIVHEDGSHGLRIDYHYHNPLFYRFDSSLPIEHPGEPSFPYPWSQGSYNVTAPYTLPLLSLLDGRHLMVDQDEVALFDRQGRLIDYILLPNVRVALPVDAPRYRDGVPLLFSSDASWDLRLSWVRLR